MASEAEKILKRLTSAQRMSLVATVKEKRPTGGSKSTFRKLVEYGLMEKNVIVEGAQHSDYPTALGREVAALLEKDTDFIEYMHKHGYGFLFQNPAVLKLKREVSR